MIYLDHHATTPVDPRVLDAMLPTFTQVYGNAASRNHAFGWAAEEAVEQGRSRVARLIGATAKEIVFTSGATEAINLALKGAGEIYAPKGRHLVTTAVEHKATLDTCAHLAGLGYHVTTLGVDGFGRVRPADLEAALTPETLVFSLIHGNNEVGTLQDLAPLGAICRARGVLFHVDAAQTAGKVPIDVDAMGIDLLSISGHKFYAPKGVGALYVRRKNPRVRLAPQMHGGGHERGLRSGTLNVPGIVGLGMAAEIAMAEMAAEAARLDVLRERLHRGLEAALDGVTLNGHPTERLPGNLHLSFAGIPSQNLLMSGLAEVAVSSGSACTSASLEPSHVLKAMGLPDAQVHGSIRFGLGRGTTEAEIDRAIALVAAQVRKVRASSPLLAT